MAFREYLTNGTFTVPAGITSVKATLIGGGGGSGGISIVTPMAMFAATGGGGAGQLVEQYVTVTPGDVINVTIGTGGVGGNSGTAPNESGVAGNATSFGSLTAAGGAGSAGMLNGVITPGNPGANGAGGIAFTANSNQLMCGGSGGGIIGSACTALAQQNDADTYSTVITYAPINNTVGYNGAPGTVAQPNETLHPTGISGPGYLGRGGGGGGGGTYYPISRPLAYAGPGNNGGGNGGLLLLGSLGTSQGTAGTANTGSGGGGSILGTAAGATVEGASGGSGYALIEWIEPII